MTRKQAFATKSQDFHYGKMIKKLTLGEFAMVSGFIDNNDHLDHIEFERAATRWFINHPAKPKNEAIMTEILHAVNSLAKGKRATS